MSDGIRLNPGADGEKVDAVELGNGNQLGVSALADVVAGARVLFSLADALAAVLATQAGMTGGSKANRVLLYGADGNAITTLPVSLASAPLPSDAATQTTLAAVLSILGGGLPSALVSGRLPVQLGADGVGLALESGGNLATAASRLASIITLLAGGLPAALGTSGGLKASLVDLGGAATASAQSTSNTHLSAISTDTLQLVTYIASILSTLTDATARTGLLGANGTGIATTSNPLPVEIVTTTDTTGWNVSTIRTGGDFAIAVDVQLKSGAGKLRSIEVTHSTGGTLYVGGYNKSGALASGDYPIGRHLSAGNTVPATLDFGLDGYDFDTGLRIGVSSTPVNYAAASTPSANTINISVRWR